MTDYNSTPLSNIKGLMKFLFIEFQLCIRNQLLILGILYELSLLYMLFEDILIGLFNLQ